MTGPKSLVLMMLLSLLPRAASVPVTPPPLANTCDFLGPALCQGGSTCVAGEDGVITCLCPEGRTGNSCQFVSDGTTVTTTTVDPADSQSEITTTVIPATQTVPALRSCGIVKTLFCPKAESCYFDARDVARCVCAPGYTGPKCDDVMADAPGSAGDAADTVTSVTTVLTSTEGTASTAAEVSSTRRPCGFLTAIACPKAEGCYLDERGYAVCVCGPGRTGQTCGDVISASGETAENVTSKGTADDTTPAPFTPITRTPCGHLTAIACPEAEGCYLDERGYARCVCGPGRTGQRCDQIMNTPASPDATTRRTCGAMRVFCYHASACFMGPGGIPLCVCSPGYTGARCGTEISAGPGAAANATGEPASNTTLSALPTPSTSEAPSDAVTPRPCGILKTVACPKAVDCYLDARSFATCVCGPGSTGSRCDKPITTTTDPPATAPNTTSPAKRGDSTPAPPPSSTTYNASTLCSLCLHITSCIVPDKAKFAVCTCQKGWKGANCDVEGDVEGGVNLPGVRASTQTDVKRETPDGVCGTKSVCTNHTGCDASGDFRCQPGWGGEECCVTCSLNCSPGHCQVSRDGTSGTCVCPERYLSVPKKGCLDVCGLEPAKHDVCDYDHESKDTQRYVIVGAVLGTLFLLAACLITFVCVVRHCAYRN